jgi:hypothetical protein
MASLNEKLAMYPEATVVPACHPYGFWRRSVTNPEAAL